MQTIVIYGGAFNPPTTTGHRHVIEQLLQIIDAGDVCIAPTYRHYLKDDIEKSFNTRLDMCRLTFAGLNVHIDDLERRAALDGCDGSTIELVEYLMKNNPNIDIKIIVGVDNADSINLWKRHAELITMASFIVVARGGYAPKLNWYKMKPHQFIDIPMHTISSSMIRDALIQGNMEFVKQHIHPDVIPLLIRDTVCC